jgi:pimeloyl-ACP methyl ester carboxylesterase
LLSIQALACFRDGPEESIHLRKINAAPLPNHRRCTATCVALFTELPPAPTLVMHARGDAQIPVELGRQLAAGIPGARFVALQGNNHVLLEQDPATQRFFEEVRLFLKT